MFLLMARWLDTHREEKRIIATKNAKIAKKGRAKGFFRCVVVRGLTTPQKRTVENTHKERRDRTGGWAECFFRCPVVRESLMSEDGSVIVTKNAMTTKRAERNVSFDVHRLDTRLDAK